MKITAESGWGVSTLIVSDRAGGGTEAMMDRNGGVIICSPQRALKWGEKGRWTWNGSTRRQTCKGWGKCLRNRREGGSRERVKNVREEVVRMGKKTNGTLRARRGEERETREQEWQRKRESRGRLTWRRFLQKGDRRFKVPSKTVWCGETAEHGSISLWSPDCGCLSPLFHRKVSNSVKSAVTYNHFVRMRNCMSPNLQSVRQNRVGLCGTFQR